MNRLRDMDGDEPLFRHGVEVIRKTPPTPRAGDLKQRVWRSIQRAPAPAPRRVGPLFLKVALVVIVALGAGTAGAVIVGRRWIATRPDAAAAPAPVVRSAAPARHDRATPAPPAEAGPEVTAELPAATPGARPAARPTPKKVTAAPAPPSAAAVARERTEVLDALVALRREHDPARAGTLLGRYLSAHPSGALREEALALAMEAADARGDRAGAAQLARVYQREFPAGRFLIFARSHTDNQPTH